MTVEDYVVHIVDDEEPIRKSLVFLLAMNGMAARPHETADAFLAFAPKARDAVLVTDLRMPEMSGIELIREVRAINPRIMPIVMTGHGDIPMAVEAMKAGAVDFIEKPFDDKTLLNAIRQAASQLAPAEGADENAEEIRKRYSTLSERERQVLSAVVRGHANKTIAFDLDISPRTVEVHRANVMQKMGASSLPQLVRFALVLGPGS